MRGKMGAGKPTTGVGKIGASRRIALRQDRGGDEDQAEINTGRNQGCSRTPDADFCGRKTKQRTNRDHEGDTLGKDGTRGTRPNRKMSASRFGQLPESSLTRGLRGTTEEDKAARRVRTRPDDTETWDNAAQGKRKPKRNGRQAT